MTTLNATQNLTVKAKELNQVLPFGLSVITKYSNGKITAKIVHGNDQKVSIRVSYDHGLNTNENHIHAALVLIEKLKNDHDKEFIIKAMSYNEKDDGYSFLTERLI